MKSNPKSENSQGDRTLSEDDAISILRNRQMSDILISSPQEGLPVWYWAMTRKSPRAVEMAMALGDAIDRRLPDGRGFLLAALDEAMPRWLLVHGLRKLDGTWWHPDQQGRSVFSHEHLDAVVAQALGHRAWSEGLTTLISSRLGNPARQAKTAGRKEVGRALGQWFRTD